MKPTLGEVVLYTLDPDSARDMFDNSGATEVPAIVVGVSTATVNLQLLPNSNAKVTFREGVAQDDAQSEDAKPGTWRPRPTA